MKVSILGAGDREKVLKHAGLKAEELDSLIKATGETLARLGAEIIIVPARGIPLEVARAYKKAGGKSVTGLVPRDDKRYGLGHIEEYLGEADQEVNIGTWYDLNGEIASQGQASICIGLSPGAMLDMCFMKYHRKYLGSKTRLIIFENTISRRLQPELEQDLGQITYIKSAQELEKALKG
jgi:hypothetical protein